MEIGDVEREVISIIVTRFVRQGESTGRKELLVKFKQPDVLDRLTNCSFIRAGDGASLLPMVLAFEYCGDPDMTRRARQSLEILLHALQNLFEVELEKSEFSQDEIQEQARKIYDKPIDLKAIKLGLYLAQEFNVLSGW